MNSTKYNSLDDDTEHWQNIMKALTETVDAEKSNKKGGFGRYGYFYLQDKYTCRGLVNQIMSFLAPPLHLTQLLLGVGIVRALAVDNCTPQQHLFVVNVSSDSTSVLRVLRKLAESRGSAIQTDSILPDEVTKMIGNSNMYSLCYDHTHGHLFSGAWNGRIDMWFLDDQQGVGHITIEEPGARPVHPDFQVNILRDKIGKQTPDQVRGRRPKPIRFLYFHHNTNSLYCGSNDGTIKEWQYTSSTSSSMECVSFMKASCKSIISLAFDGHSRTLFTTNGDSTIQIWTEPKIKPELDNDVDVDIDTTKKMYQQLLLCDTLDAGEGRLVYCLAYDPDNHMLFSGGVNGVIQVWRRSNSTKYMLCTAILQAHEYDITCLLYDYHTKKLHSAGDDRIIKVWDVESWA